VLCASDEVGEGVDLVELAAVQEPAPALVRAAAHMGNGVDETAINQRQPVRREARLDRAR